jgi:hypothetical protein
VVPDHPDGPFHPLSYLGFAGHDADGWCQELLLEAASDRLIHGMKNQERGMF